MTSASTYSERPPNDPTSLSSDEQLQHSAAWSTLEPQAARERAAQELPTLGNRPTPAVRRGAVEVAEPVAVYVTESAWQQIADHADSDWGVELGGALLGHAYRQGRQLVVVVSAALPAHSNDNGPVHFTFTADAWAQLHVDRNERFAETAIVGWYHTHPDLGVFYSSDDVVVHSAGFVMPWHVGFVLDPCRRELAAFGWRSTDAAPPTLGSLTGYYHVGQASRAGQRPWRYLQAPVWSTFSESTLAGLEGVDGLTAVTRPLTNAPYNWPLILGVTALLLFLGAFWRQQRQVDQLETIVLNQHQNQLATTSGPDLAFCPSPELTLLAPSAGQTLEIGTVVDIVGRAAQPEASRYLVGYQGHDGVWHEIDSLRLGRSLGRLTRWSTAGLAPGRYALRLSAYDRHGAVIALPAPGRPAGADETTLNEHVAASCVIAVELVAPLAALSETIP